MIIKTMFDGGNLIRQKAYQEYDGSKSLSQYLNTKNGKEKVKSLCERYFKAIGVTVNVEYIELDILVRNELIIKLDIVTDDDLQIIMSSPISFY